VVARLRERLPWVARRSGRCTKAEFAKERNAPPARRRGRCDRFRRVVEDGVRYALALDLNRDASLYLDTRALRAWAKAKLAGKKVLNTFAYTGSLGVAAMAAPASRVVHVDRNRAFLNVAKESYALNGFSVKRADFVATDFFEALGRFKKEGALFDCAMLDPPFFSQTRAGRVDLEGEADRLLNKIRRSSGDGACWSPSTRALRLRRRVDALRSRRCAPTATSPSRAHRMPRGRRGFAPRAWDARPEDPAPFNAALDRIVAVLRVAAKDAARA